MIEEKTEKELFPAKQELTAYEVAIKKVKNSPLARFLGDKEKELIPPFSPDAKPLSFLE